MAEQTKHTPGPWMIDGDQILGPGDDYLIETDEGDQWFTQVCQGSGNWEANARLIAAAPDLLHACNVIMTAERDWQGKCAAAIALATQQQ